MCARVCVRVCLLGTLDRLEMKGLLESLGTVNKGEIESNINQMDWEGDGKVSFE